MGEFFDRNITKHTRRKIFKKLFENWFAHTKICRELDLAFCPVCEANQKNLVWKCHNLSVKEALEKARDVY